MQSQQSLILIETRVSFLQTYRIQMVQVIYIIFWPEGLLTFYDSDKGLSTIRLIFSKSNYFKVWRHPLKVLDKVLFLQGRGAVDLQQRKEFITLRSKVANTKATIYFFYIPIILINTHSRIQYRGCENLATSIDSSMKSFTSLF